MLKNQIIFYAFIHSIASLHLEEMDRDLDRQALDADPDQDLDPAKIMPIPIRIRIHRPSRYNKCYGSGLCADSIRSVDPDLERIKSQKGH
jgi:hypothetical protein